MSFVIKVREEREVGKHEYDKRMNVLANAQAWENKQAAAAGRVARVVHKVDSSRECVLIVEFFE